MFNPRTGSPSSAFFQQQATFNPFTHGGAFGSSPFQQPFGVQPQQTGFVMPQQTAFPQSPYNPFGQHLQPQITAMPFMQPQPTAAPMMPQMTGINPFRQNALNGMNGIQPQATGFGPSPFGPSPTTPSTFGASPTSPSSFGPSPTTLSSFGPSPTTLSPFGPSPTNQGASPFQNFGQTPGQQQQMPFNPASPFNVGQQPNVNSPFTLPPQLQQQQSQPPPQPQNPANNMSIPPRPASAPLKTSSPEPIKPLVAQQTGSKNPFGIPTSPPPPVPKIPTLMELAMNKQQELYRMQQQQQNGQPGQNSSAISNPTAGSTMSSVASDFTGLNIGNNPAANSLSPQMTSTTNSSFSADTLFSSVSSQPTGTTTSTIPSISVQPTGGLNSNTTGLGTFTGLKTFKPSSSFGASLLESLPPIPGSGPTTPSATSDQGQLGQGQLGSPPNSTLSSPGLTTSSTTLGGLGGLGTSGLNPGPGIQNQPNGLNSTFGGSGLNTQLGALNSQQPLTTGMGTGLGPQMTGAQGLANPFRMTAFSSSTSTPGLGTNPNPGLGGGFTGGFGGFGGTPFGQGPATQPQPQQQQQGSLV